MSSIQTTSIAQTEAKKQEELPVASNEMDVDSKAPVVTDDKPVLASSETAPTVTETETQPIQTIATDDKIEPVVPATNTSDDVIPPTPIAKETAVDDKKVEEPVAAATSETAAAPAVSTPKKEKKGIFARITGMFASSSPEKKDKVHKTEATPSKPTAAVPTTTVDASKPEAALLPEASTSTAVAPTVAAPAAETSTTEDVNKLTEGVNVLNIVKEPKKETSVEAPIVSSETAETSAVVPKEETVTASDSKKDVVKPSPSTPKMHRRISARIGQYIDTRFGDKKDRTASPPPTKKDGAVVEETAGEGKVVEEVKTDVAPVLAPPISVAPLEEVTAPVETQTQTETQVAKSVAV